MFVSKEANMYISKKDTKPVKKYWMVWKIRANSTQCWLAKEDCPGVLYGNYNQAIKEADRLAQVTQETFVVLEAVAVVSYKVPEPVIMSEIRLLTAY